LKLHNAVARRPARRRQAIVENIHGKEMYSMYRSVVPSFPPLPPSWNLSDSSPYLSGRTRQRNNVHLQLIPRNGSYIAISANLTYSEKLLARVELASRLLHNFVKGLTRNGGSMAIMELDKMANLKSAC